MKNLLIKIPTRERGTWWMKHYLDNVSDSPNTKIVLTTDNDQRGSVDVSDPRYSVIFGDSKSKIDAYNRDIDEISKTFDWDVIMVGSDDMWPNTPAFDQIILDDMAEHFPDGDGCLWYNTEDSEEEIYKNRGRVRKPFGSHAWMKAWICMLPVMGRKYYDRFGYIYYPEYKSFSCDDEYTDVAMKLDKIKPINRTFIDHQNPCWKGGMPSDQLYRANNKNWNHDRDLYTSRKRKNFPT